MTRLLDKRQRGNARFAILALLTATFAAGLAFLLLKPAAVPVRATLLPEPQPVAAFELLDQDGQTFTDASFRGRFSLVFFGFTHCPDVCPLTLGKLQAARRQMAETLDDEALPTYCMYSLQ